MVVYVVLTLVFVVFSIPWLIRFVEVWKRYDTEFDPNRKPVSSHFIKPKKGNKGRNKRKNVRKIPINNR